MPKISGTKDYVLLAAGNTATFDVADYDVETINLIADGGAITLANDITIDPTGTPVEGTLFRFNYPGNVTIGAHSVEIFGYSMTAAEALATQEVICSYNDGSWVVKLIMIKTFGGSSSIDGSAIINETINGIKLIAQSVPLSKHSVLTDRGYMTRAGAGGVIEEFDAIVSGSFIGNDGVDVMPMVMTGDVTLSGATATIGNDKVTTSKILDGSITVAKTVAALKTDIINVVSSFETGELGAIKVYIPYKCSVINVYAIANKTIAATDNGTIVFKNNAGVTMTVTTPIVFTASDAFGTAYQSAVTANNTFLAGEYLTVLSAKTTAGGKALLTITLLKSD